MTETEFIAKLGTELGIPPERLEKSAPLASFSAWDSMGKMAVLALIDTELQQEIPAGALQKCQTVGDLLGLLQNKLTP
jgi:acyl carrier protein